MEKEKLIRARDGKKNYNGNEYEMILFNDKGKQFLLDNLERIMDFNAESDSGKAR